ncbi:GNAT family N-acetyltransferase [Glaciecola sp. 1036]|uniref:GNAT family N-acetyltransferase n=1 Tax=Alteromonadaceae TaxID=72275 RepID=UPI003D00FAE8
MAELRQGSPEFAEALGPLIYSAAPELLNFIFKSEREALNFFALALPESDGQFSAYRHQIAVHDDKCIGCISFWYEELPQSFHLATIDSLQNHLSLEALQHLLSVNPYLVALFPPPIDSELCIGHLAVLSEQRGRGIGKSLLNFAKQQAMALQKQRLVLDVNAANTQALAFYQEFGFTCVKQTEFTHTGDKFVRMHFDLTS